MFLRGEIIQKKDITVLLIFICFMGLSLNFAYATNETDLDIPVLDMTEDISPQETLELEEATEEIQVDNLTVSENSEESTNLTSNEPKTIEITQANYEFYFNVRTGGILNDSGIKSGDTIKIGNITNRAFVIDRQLTIMPITPKDKISNGFIHLIKGSDGSVVTNLTINNTKGSLTFRGSTVGQLHGIWLSNTNNNLIAYNTIRLANTAGVYAMPMGWSSNNRIIYNDMKTYITSNIIMGQCHNNLISHNSLEVLSYSDLSVTNLIYYNPFGHADYSGSPLCLGNVITYNNLTGFSTGPMSIILQMTYAKHDETVVANNTIFKGSYGVNINGNNITVYGNVIHNSATGISIGGSNFTVHNNTIYGDSQDAGILASGSLNSTCKIYDNNITFNDLTKGIAASDNVEVYCNNINIAGYGVGIAISDSYSNVYGNRIKNYHDCGISILGSYNTVDNNVINTKNIGVSIPAYKKDKRYYGNSISRNKITSDQYGISITGLVYNTTILDNIIETNSSIGIYKQITDELSNTELDNIVNGIILNPTAITVNDSNYNKYFDKDGRLTYEFEKNKSKVIFLTFLTNKNLIFDEKINIISNKMSNLLYNVTITLTSNASGSLIRDFNFINHGREAIIVDSAFDVNIIENNITDIINKNSRCENIILFSGNCENAVVFRNNIYVNSKNKRAVAIGDTKKTAKGFSINNNTIIMISSGISEAINLDVCDSEFNFNKINIISKTAYGFNFNNFLSNININENEIIIYCDDNAYLIKLNNINNSIISNNNLYGESKNVYGIHVNNSNEISIQNNFLTIFGSSNVAISINNTQSSLISNNLIYTNLTNPISSIGETSYQNSYIIDDRTYNVYFDNENVLKKDILSPKSTLLLHNLTKTQRLIINTPIEITSYDFEVSSKANITFDIAASNSILHNIKFINSEINLANASNIVISSCDFNNSCLNIYGGELNEFKLNKISHDLDYSAAIRLTGAVSSKISDNIFSVAAQMANVIVIKNSNSSYIINNIINSTAKLTFINSTNSNNDNVYNNTLNANSSVIYMYLASNAQNGEIKSNNIFTSNLTNKSPIYYVDSSNNSIYKNRIITTSEYAVVIVSNGNSKNRIKENYLISDNELKYGDESVFAPLDDVDLNTPRDIFVSTNGSDVDGNGKENNPYASLKKAIENALNYSTIYISNGTYTESDILIDKNLTIITLNPGSVIINANSSQLFNITSESTVSISGVIIENAHNVNGGSAFINNGKLLISNSVICNSSSYYDNSHPVFNQNMVYEDNGELKTAYTVDCSHTGVGGAILNNGTLSISSSVFFNNLGHKGGVIADFGKTLINSSLFYNNLGVHGGVIYSNTHSQMIIENTTFTNNTSLTTLDYCTIKLYTTAWSIDEGNIHQVNCACGDAPGIGGAIYSNNNMLIEDSNFINNSARVGGAIASYGTPNLEIKNTLFKNNRANDTRRSLGNIELDYYHFTNGYDGGAIYGNYNKLHINSSRFYKNQATHDGGAINAKASNGLITDSIFDDNIAGVSGGALDISNNFLIMRTIISNNSASYGGAIEYTSEVYYGHIQDNLNIYNSTISNNKALDSGGAFNIGTGNISIHDSNIVNNFAPAYNTIHSMGGTYAIDMRYNYWGTASDGFNGPDNSVWKVSNTQFKPWYSQWVNWNVGVIGGNSDANPTNPNSNPTDNTKPNENPSKPENTNPTNTGTGTSSSTGEKIGGGNGHSYAGSGDGTNMGYSGDGGAGHGSYYSLLKGNGYNGQKIIGIAGNGAGQSSGNPGQAHNSNSKSSGNNGNVNLNSLSRTNSSNYNPNLASIGMTANTASSSPQGSSGSDGGESGGSADSSESISQSVSKSYELNEKDFEILTDEDSIYKFLIYAVIVLLLLIIGYKQKEKEEDN